MTNPFFEPSPLPFGLPPFASIDESHYLPAFERGMAEQRAEIEAIVQTPDAPTFANTLVALERSGQTLSRVATVFFNKASADSDEFTDALEEQLAPALAAHSDAIRLNSALFARIRAVRSSPAFAALDAESQYLVERYLAELTQAGAGLSDSDKERLRALNQELSTLTTRFQKNLLADTNALAVVIDDVAELDGLGAGEISAAAQAAAERGMPGTWVVTLTLFSGHPYLSVLTNRGVRERIMHASLARGRRGGEFDNRSLVVSIARLRATRAALLGFTSHAALVTSDETARTPQAVAALLGQLAGPAARNARAEQAALQQQIGDAFPLESWDWAFYSEKVRTERFDIDLAALRPYLEAENVLQNGVFWAAGQLYGVTFAERADLVAYHPGARVFEVRDSDGSAVGLYMLDLYTRDSKRGGAWMNSLISQNGLLGHPVIVTNNLNVPKPAPGTPTLLTFDEVTTLFHEFGHALHGLFARVTYPKFSGTSVFRDFVEFPSQVNEMWMLWPSVLSHYAVHHLTGEKLPDAFTEKLQQSAGFNEGFATSEYLAAALLDQAWHALPAAAAAAAAAAGSAMPAVGAVSVLPAVGAGSVLPAVGAVSVLPAADARSAMPAADTAVLDAAAAGDVDHADAVGAFEAAALAAVGLDNPVIPPRYASTYFAHIFSGGYDAGYYSYIWSEVLDADTVEWFRENGGLTRANGDRFRQRLLGVGGSRDPLDAYRDFRGRDADIAPLLARRGLTD